MWAEGRVIRRFLNRLGVSARRATQDRALPPADASAPAQATGRRQLTKEIRQPLDEELVAVSPRRWFEALVIALMRLLHIHDHPLAFLVAHDEMHVALLPVLPVEDIICDSAGPKVESTNHGLADLAPPPWFPLHDRHPPVFMNIFTAKPEH
jgi:hypothetical protein